jgi:hypothetical protein
VDDDALAWQACHVHSGLSLQARFTATLFSSSAVLFCAFVTVHDPVLRSILIAVSCGFTLIVLAFKPSDCLSREVKGKTLSTLALLPLDGREIYQAWQRGARRMARSTYVAVAAGGIVLTVIAPDAAPFLWMAFAFAVVLLPEIAFLSNVLSQKTTFLDAFLDQVLMAIGIIALICVTLAISIPISMGFHPWAGLMTFVAISLAGRSLLMGELASFVADRIEREQ